MGLGLQATVRPIRLHFFVVQTLIEAIGGKLPKLDNDRLKNVPKPASGPGQGDCVQRLPCSFPKEIFVF